MTGPCTCRHVWSKRQHGAISVWTLPPRGYDQADSDALCLPRLHCAELCDSLGERCAGFDAHETKNRCFLQGPPFVERGQGKGSWGEPLVDGKAGGWVRAGGRGRGNKLQSGGASVVPGELQSSSSYVLFDLFQFAYT